MNRGKVFRYIRNAVICALLVAAALYFIPWPSKIDVVMTGSEIRKDGTPFEDCTISLHGWKHNYLFRDDTIKVDVQINSPSDLNLEGMYHTTIFKDIPEYDFVSYLVYLAKTNSMDALTLYFDEELTWSVLTVDDRQFVVSTDPDADLQDYWKMCTE